jgi:hypothetical protein
MYDKNLLNVIFKMIVLQNKGEYKIIYESKWECHDRKCRHWK